MPGSMSAAIKRRQLRQIGNKNTIPNKHPDGNKGTMAPGSFGRAASSQFATAKGKNPFQGGATFGDAKSGGGADANNQQTGYRTGTIDQMENKKRNRTPPGDEAPPGQFTKGALSRRQKGK